MSDRIVIVSDLHLGRARGGASSADALRPIWEGASRFIVNGDVAEVHDPQHQAIAALETLKLSDLCESDEVELTLISGNHDPYVTDVRHLSLFDDAVFVTHGDALHPAITPWSPGHDRMQHAQEAAMANIDPDDRDSLESRLHASQHACYSEWKDLDRLADEARHTSPLGMLLRPHAVFQVLRYWRAFPQMAARFGAAYAPRARFIVMGHTHRAGIWKIDERVIINTGSYGFPGRPRAVVIENGALRVHDVVRKGRTYRLAENAVASYEVAPLAASEAPIPAPAVTDAADQTETRRAA
jgi:predicted phosphodiesterase